MERSLQGMFSPAVCFVQIDLLEFGVLGRTEYCLEVSIGFSGSGVFCFLKHGNTTEAAELSMETASISHARLFSFHFGGFMEAFSRSTDILITNLCQ